MIWANEPFLTTASGGFGLIVESFSAFAVMRTRGTGAGRKMIFNYRDDFGEVGF